MVFKVGDDNVALWIKRDPSWCRQTFQITTVVQSVERKSRNEMTIRAEELNSMIARVCDQNLRFCINSNGPRIHKLAKFLAIRTELMNEYASAWKYLDAMIVLVNNYNSIVCIRWHACWQIKLAVPSSLWAELELESSISKKYLNTIITTIRDNNFVALVDTNSPRSRYLSVLVTIKTERQSLRRE